MRRSKHGTTGTTLVEIISVLAILAVLAAILCPLVIDCRRRAADSVCISNLHQISHAIAMYTDDYDGSYPPVDSGVFTGAATRNGNSWSNIITPYLGQLMIPRCPDVWLPDRIATLKNATDTCGYGYNELLNQPFHARYNGKHEAVVQWPTVTIVLGDVRAGLIGMRQPDTGTPGALLAADHLTGMHREIMEQVPGAIRHHGGANYAFADGHTKWMIPSQIFVAEHGDGVRPSMGP